jgi:hypothetical protein
VQPGGLGKLKKFNNLIGSGTLDLSACSVVPQPLRYRVVRGDKMTFPHVLT